MRCLSASSMSVNKLLWVNYVYAIKPSWYFESFAFAISITVKQQRGLFNYLHLAFLFIVKGNFFFKGEQGVKYIMSTMSLWASWQAHRQIIARQISCSDFTLCLHLSINLFHWDFIFGCSTSQTKQELVESTCSTFSFHLCFVQLSVCETKYRHFQPFVQWIAESGE